jgi:hypothetical protein
MRGSGIQLELEEMAASLSPSRSNRSARAAWRLPRYGRRRAGIVQSLLRHLRNGADQLMRERPPKGPADLRHLAQRRQTVEAGRDRHGSNRSGHRKMHHELWKVAAVDISDIVLTAIGCLSSGSDGLRGGDCGRWTACRSWSGVPTGFP